jgi:hypothetical protein
MPNHFVTSNRLAFRRAIFIMGEIALTIEPTKTERLAEALLADRQEHIQRTVTNVCVCRACGRNFSKRESDCCSQRCEEWLAAGNPPHDPNFAQKCIDLPPPEPAGIPMRSWKLVAGNPRLKCAPDMKVGDSYYGPILDHFHKLKAERLRREKAAKQGVVA